MIFVDMNINGPGIRQVLYELRINPTTGEDPDRDPGRRRPARSGRTDCAERTQRVIAVPRPHSPEVLADVVEQLQHVSGRDRDAAERTRGRKPSRPSTWLAKLAGRRPPVLRTSPHEPVIEAALYQRDRRRSRHRRARPAWHPESQRALVEFREPTHAAGRQPRRRPPRRFATSVAAHGLLLTSDEILAQYDRYNASATRRRRHATSPRRAARRHRIPPRQPTPATAAPSHPQP